nr:NAD(P)-dependent alcohol dehydrogenase [Sphingomonas sp. Y57]
MRIKAAVAHRGRTDFDVATLTLDDPREDEILVRIEAVGLCHTDIVFRDMETAVSLPAVLGHEGAGIVERVGAKVTKVGPGDKVLLTFRSCGGCDRCSEGHSAYCRRLPELNFVGQRTDGSKALRAGAAPVSSNFFGQSSFATHALAYERNVVRIAPELSSVTYAPLGCGVQTGAGAIMNSLDCKAGSTLAVIGAGTVGLSAIMAAAIRECAQIIVIEPKAERRALALELGATHAIDPLAEAVVDRVRALVPHGVDTVLDTSGVVPALEAALGYLGSHGVIGLVGVPSVADAAISIPIANAITFGFSIKGIIEGDSEPDHFIPELIDLHRQGRFPFDRLIRSYRLDDINDAVRDQHDGVCVKAVLVPEADFQE